MQSVYPVLLCGGSGTRLWPLSRKSYPKQFSQLIGAESLFQSTAKRMAGQSSGLSFNVPVILTNADFRFIVTEQLTELGIDPGATTGDQSAAADGGQHPVYVRQSFKNFLADTFRLFAESL